MRVRSVTTRRLVPMVAALVVAGASTPSLAHQPGVDPTLPCNDLCRAWFAQPTAQEAFRPAPVEHPVERYEPAPPSIAGDALETANRHVLARRHVRVAVREEEAASPHPVPYRLKPVETPEPHRRVAVDDRAPRPTASDVMRPSPVHEARRPPSPPIPPSRPMDDPNPRPGPSVAAKAKGQPPVRPAIVVTRLLTPAGHVVTTSVPSPVASPVGSRLTVAALTPQSSDADASAGPQAEAARTTTAAEPRVDVRPDGVEASSGGDPVTVRIGQVSAGAGDTDVHVVVVNTLGHDVRDVEVRCYASDRTGLQVAQASTLIADVAPSDVAFGRVTLPAQVSTRGEGLSCVVARLADTGVTTP